MRWYRGKIALFVLYGTRGLFVFLGEELEI